MLLAVCLRDLYFRLQPDGKIPAVRDFLERTRSFVEG
jgi:hypothetical protein